MTVEHFEEAAIAVRCVLREDRSFIPALMTLRALLRAHPEYAQPTDMQVDDLLFLIKREVSVKKNGHHELRAREFFRTFPCKTPEQQHIVSFWFGITDNSFEQRRYLELAAAGGNGLARLGLAVMCVASGNFTQAGTLFTQAADSGLADGYTGLARMHVTGQGVPADKDKARQLYTRACVCGSTTAMLSLGGSLRFSDPVEYRRLVKMAAEAGSSYALVWQVQDLLDNGTFTSISEDKISDAVPLLERAVDMGNSQACTLLSLLHSQKIIPKADLLLAHKYKLLGTLYEQLEEL